MDDESLHLRLFMFSVFPFIFFFPTLNIFQQLMMKLRQMFLISPRSTTDDDQLKWWRPGRPAHLTWL